MVAGVFRLILVLAALQISFVVPAAAQQAIVFDKSNLKPGLVLVYISSRKVRSETTMVSRTEFRTDSGARHLRNADGNSLRSGSRKFSPHSGIRPPGARGNLQVGMKWKHTYTVEGVRRTRTCKVTRSGTYKNRHITVANAFLVKCLNKRADRPKGMNEQIWFTPALFVELEYRSSAPGHNYSHKVVGIK